MKKLLHFTLLVGTCFVIGGCPYETQVPIDTPSVKINPGLLGTWINQDNEDESYMVSEHDEYTYHIVMTQVADNESEDYLAFVSLINKTMFLNVSKTAAMDASPMFMLYKLEQKNNQSITLTEVSENIDEIFASSQELKKFISKNMDNSYFYGKGETNLVRAVK